MEEHEKGRDAFESDEAYRLHCLRHSAAHVMAEAIGEIFEGARFAIGPAIADGFYYDVEVSRPITDDDLAAIELRMKQIVKRNSKFEQEEWDAAKARAYFEEHDQRFKVELIEGLGDQPITVYHQGGFTDLCRGPHVQRTGNCKHFKLLKVSGAYWRGDPQKPQLQRVYGTVWPNKEQLDTYLHRLEEAKKRDHRRVGRELELLMFHEWAPGVPFFLPKGEVVMHTLSETMRSRLLRDGYVAVRTPQLFAKRLWETSGHWEHFRDDMFNFEERREATAPAEEAGAEGEAHEHDHVMSLKPMNCPSHMLIFRAQKRSYRDLPYRIHDQGVLHRNEIRGALSGLTRVRQFCQDDAHLFMREDQIESEVTALVQLLKEVYGAFGLGYSVALATRPADKLGDDALWDAAEAALRGALAATAIDYVVHEGDGAFYGPKIDFEVVDALDRRWQCATIQLDYQLSRRFRLTYVGEDNAEHVPVVIHRAIYGSLERFLGILIEHYAGAFPVWLAPEQVRVLTVSEKSEAHGRAVTEALKAAGVRVYFDDRSSKISYKIRECHNMKVPYMAVIGEREQETGTVSVRGRDGDEGSLEVAAFVARVVEESKLPF